MKNVIITGANSGLGFETALKIAKTSDEYNLILACRNIKKAKLAQEKIISKSNNSNVEIMQLDTSDLNSIRKFAEDFKYAEIYALVCNAGINGMQSGITKDGFDVVFETNHLGHFLLTNLLLNKITNRIFVVSSDMHNPPSGLDWINPEQIAHPTEEVMPKRYFYSKLCNLYFVYELARRTDLLVNAFNPGFMVTNFANVNKERVEFVKNNMPDRFGDLEKSSDALSTLITSESLTESGNYYDRSINHIKSSDLSYNTDNSKELWLFSEKATNLGDD